MCGAAQEVSIARRREARSKSKNVHPLTIFFDLFFSFVCCAFPFVVFFFALFFHSLSIYSGPPSLHPTPTVYTYTIYILIKEKLVLFSKEVGISGKKKRERVRLKKERGEPSKRGPLNNRRERERGHQLHHPYSLVNIAVPVCPLALLPVWMFIECCRCHPLFFSSSSSSFLRGFSSSSSSIWMDSPSGCCCCCLSDPTPLPLVH